MMIDSQQLPLCPTAAHRHETRAIQLERSDLAVSRTCAW